MKLRVLLLSISIAFPVLALAHGNEEHVRGVLKTKEGSTLVLTTSTGESRLEIDANTHFEAGGKPATADDIRIGQRMVIHASRHDGTLRATRVQLGAMESEPQKGQKP